MSNAEADAGLLEAFAEEARRRCDVITAGLEAGTTDFETLRGLGISGMINIPVIANGVVIGSLNISGEAGQFSEAEIPALTVLANLLAPALTQYQ